MNRAKKLIDFANDAAQEHGIIGDLFQEAEVVEDGEYVICSINDTEIVVASDSGETEDGENMYYIDYAERDENSSIVQTEFSTTVVTDEKFIQTYMFMLTTYYLQAVIFSIDFYPDVSEDDEENNE